MKKILALLLIALVAISPLFRGLFFNLEAHAFFTLIALISVLYFLVKLANREPIHMDKWLLIFGSLLVLAYAISFTNAVNIRENIDTLIQYTEYLIISIILYDYFHDKKEHFGLSFMIPVIITGFLSALIGLIALTKAFDIFNVTLHDERVGSVFQYYNAAAIYFGICIFFCLSLINSLKNNIPRLLLSGVGSILFLALILTGSRGGFLVFALVFFIFFVMQPTGFRLGVLAHFFSMALPAIALVNKISSFHSTKNYLSMITWIAITFMFTIVISFSMTLLVKAFNKLRPLVWNIIFVSLSVSILAIFLVCKDKLTALIPEDILHRWTTFGFDSLSIFYRLEFSKDALKLIQQNWLLGFGGGGWTSLYQSVQDTFYTARAVHNHYFQIFVEAGILGFLAFIGTVLITLLYTVLALGKEKNIQNSLLRTGLCSAFLALTIHSAMDFELSFPSLLLLFSILITGITIFHIKIENKRVTIKKPIIFLFIVIGSALFSINAIFTTGAFYADNGLRAIETKKYTTAIMNYERVTQIDPLNSTYTFQLTKLYNYYATKSSKPEDATKWRSKALLSGEKSIILNPFYPANLEILIRTYFESNLPLKALETSKRLVHWQPLNSDNYELLARGYLEAAKESINHSNIEDAKILLLECIEVDNLPNANKMLVKPYKQEALKLLEIYN